MSLIERTDADALIPVETSDEIIKAITQQSAALALMRKLPNMSRKQVKMPVLSALATAGFVTGDTGLKATSKAAWANKFITAEEIAVIIPVPEAVLDDAEYDIFGEMKPQIVEAFGMVIDGATFFSVDKPASWPSGLYDGAVAAGKSVYRGAGIDIAADVDSLMALVEASGYDVTGFAAAVGVKSSLRGLRDNTGALLYQPSLQVGTPGALYGQTINYPKNGAWDAAKALMIGGDFSQAVYSIRQDITYKVLDQAVISDGDGKIIYNLAQQDMVALRVVMRLGWQLPNPINRMDGTANRYPFAILAPTLAALTELDVVTVAGEVLTGDSVVSIDPSSAGTGMKYVYKKGTSYYTFVYGEDLSTWTDVADEDTIAAGTSTKLTVALVTTAGAARARGIAVINKKA
jgi:HK97 family phage major capsid protein